MDVSDLREADDAELAIAHSQMPQLPPNFSVVYRCAADINDRHQHPPRKLRKGQILARRRLVPVCEADIDDLCEVNDGELNCHSRLTNATVPTALVWFPAWRNFCLVSMECVKQVTGHMSNIKGLYTP